MKEEMKEMKEMKDFKVLSVHDKFQFVHRCPYCGDENILDIDYLDGLHFCVCNHSCEQVYVVHIDDIHTVKFYKLRNFIKSKKYPTGILPEYEIFKQAFLEKINGEFAQQFKKELLILNKENQQPYDFYRDLKSMLKSKEPELINIVKNILTTIGFKWQEWQEWE